jgi:hypothetical protein
LGNNKLNARDSFLEKIGDYIWQNLSSSAFFIMAILLTIILSVFIPNHTLEFSRDVAMRLAGEGAVSLSNELNDDTVYKLAVCTVKTRIEAGWRSDRVLDAYYAPSVPVEEKYVYLAYFILNGIDSFDCQGVYYMYSNQDINYLGIEPDRIIIKIESLSRENFGLNYVGR